MNQRIQREQTTLICTVGGSHEPVVHAINKLQPHSVCFVCSDDDPATGHKGSYQQITGKGLIIKAQFKDEKPCLPNIPAQTGLSEEQFEVLKVQPDDFDDVYTKISGWLADRNHSGENLIADYTGGTKTMSAALVAAALDDEGVKLQLVTGSRANLIKVESGSEDTVHANVQATRLQRRVQDAVAVWTHFAYAEAADLLRNIPTPSDTGQRGKLQRARDLSDAFAAWDRFDHATAQTILGRYQGILGPSLGPLFGILGLLNKEVPAREPLQLFDLYRNAERRAAAQRYDDAIARLYRLLEWSAQWLLREQAGIDTSDVPVDKIPPGLVLSKHRDGCYQAGLFNAWELSAHYCGENVTQFWREEKNVMLDHLQARNNSILAHGFEPLNEEAWQRFAGWIEGKLLPLMLSITDDRKKYRIRQLPEQLPKHYPAV
jgi:hypothetical protein